MATATVLPPAPNQHFFGWVPRTKTTAVTRIPVPGAYTDLSGAFLSANLMGSPSPKRTLTTSDRAAHDLDRYSSVTFGVVYRHAGPSNLYANAARGAAARSRGAFSTAKYRGCSKASSSCFHLAGQIVHAVGDPAASRNVERSTSATRTGKRRCFRRRAWRCHGGSDRWHAGRYQSPRGASPAASRLSREGKSACAGGRECPASTNYI
jgi:hypothetical protein